MTKLAELDFFVKKVVDREKEQRQEELAAFKQIEEQRLLTKKEQLDKIYKEEQIKKQNEIIHEQAIALNSMELEKRDAKLMIKQKLTQRYFEGIYQALLNLPIDQLIQFIQSIIDSHSENLDGLVLAEYTKNALPNDVSFSIPVNDQVINNKAGFIILSGDIEYNYLFENLVKELSRELQQILVEEVFYHV